MKKLSVFAAAILMLPQPNNAFARESAEIIIGGLITGTLVGVTAIGAVALIGSGYIGKKTIDYITLTPKKCTDVREQIALLSQDSENNAKKLYKLFDTLATCQNKFNK